MGIGNGWVVCTMTVGVRLTVGVAVVLATLVCVSCDDEGVRAVIGAPSEGQHPLYVTEARKTIISRLRGLNAVSPETLAEITAIVTQATSRVATDPHDEQDGDFELGVSDSSDSSRRRRKSSR